MSRIIEQRNLFAQEGRDDTEPGAIATGCGHSCSRQNIDKLNLASPRYRSAFCNAASSTAQCSHTTEPDEPSYSLLAVAGVHNSESSYLVAPTAFRRHKPRISR